MATFTPNLTIGANWDNYILIWSQTSSAPNFTGATVNLLVQPVTVSGSKTTPTGSAQRYACSIVNNVPQYALTGSDLFASVGVYECQLEYISDGVYLTTPPENNVYIQVLANQMPPA